MKHRCLLPALHKWSLRNLSISNIELLLRAVKAANQETLKIEIGGSASTAFEQLECRTMEDQYTVARFVDLLGDKERWTRKIKVKSTLKKQLRAVQLPEGTEDFWTGDLLAEAGKVIDLVNQGYEHQVPIFTKALLQSKVELTPENASVYFILKQALLRGVSISDTRGVEK